jgi:hypothetical protein
MRVAPFQELFVPVVTVYSLALEGHRTEKFKKSSCFGYDSTPHHGYVDSSLSNRFLLPVDRAVTHVAGCSSGGQT